MAAPDDKVISKIKKLLSLATSSNEHEASLAAERAHDLLLKHNLTVQSVASNKSTEYVDKVVYTGIFNTPESKFIVSILRDHFFVECIQTRTMNNDRAYTNDSKSTWYDRTNTLIGTKVNVEVASYVYAFLALEFRLLWKNFKSKNPLVKPQHQASYYLGLTTGLDKKLIDQKRGIENTMGLVLIKDKNLDRYISEDRGIDKQGSSILKNLNDAVINVGKIDGSNIVINKAIEDKLTNKNLKLCYKKK